MTEQQAWDSRKVAPKYKVSRSGKVYRPTDKGYHLVKAAMYFFSYAHALKEAERG